MHVDVITTHERFEQLRENWEALYRRDSQAHFFLSWRLLSRLFAQRPGEWFVLAARPTDAAEYVALFPLRRRVRMSESRQVFGDEVHMAGTFCWADYTGLICHPDHEERAIPALAVQLQRLRWRKLYLKNFPSDQRIALLTQQFDDSTFSIETRERKINAGRIDNLVCPYIDLPESFEAYLQQKLSSNSRQKVRRFLRKVEGSDEFSITESSPATHARDLDILVNYWKAKWAEHKGDKVHRLAEKYRSILETGLQEGMIYMPVLWRGDRALGVLASFIDREKKAVLFFVAGRDESCNNPPPGLILHAHSIRWAIDQGMTTYDLLRGDESYKYSLGAGDQRIHYKVLSTRSGRNLEDALDPASIDEVLEQVDSYREAGDLAKAKTGYKQVLDVCPDHAVALAGYGKLLYLEKRYKKAGEIYRRLVKCAPDDAAAWGGLGRAHAALRDFEQAESAFRMALDCSLRKSVNGHYHLGRALQHQSRYAEAATEFETLAGLAPRNDEEVRQQRKARTQLKRCREA